MLKYLKRYYRKALPLVGNLQRKKNNNNKTPGNTMLLIYLTTLQVIFLQQSKMDGIKKRQVIFMFKGH